MPTTDVTLNPGAGGAQVRTFQQSAGDVMPLSGLTVSPDGVQDFALVTAANPLPVLTQTTTTSGVGEQPNYDARAQARRDEIAAMLSTLLDVLTSGDMAVSGKSSGVPVQIADVTSSFNVSAPASTAVGTTQVTLLNANAARKDLVITNTGTVPVYLTFTGVPSATAYHVALAKCANAANDGTGGSWSSSAWKGPVFAISTSSAGTVAVAEFA